MSKDVLVVEDDDAIADALAVHLTQAGFSAHREADGLLAMAAIDRQRWDLVLLDLMLPGADGWDVCRHLRARHPDVPVIMLSARSAEAHRVLGLELGADDYLAKPFDLDELEARIRALVRRAQPLSAEPAPPPHAALRYDKASEAFYWKDQVFELTPREVAFLKALMHPLGQAVTKERLFTAVFAGEADVQLEAVEVVAYRLRKKLAPTGMQLMTLRGLGYLLKAGMPGDAI